MADGRGEEGGEPVIQSDEDLEFVRHVNACYTEAREYREPYAKNWDRWRHYRFSDQWLYKMRPAWKALPVMNYCESIIQTIIPEMTANRPTIYVQALKPGREGVADRVQESVRKTFITNRMEGKYPIVLGDSHCYGDGYVRIWFNSRSDDVAITPFDSRFFFPSPGALELQDCRYVIGAFNRPVKAIKADWKFEGEIRPGTWDEALTHLPVDPAKTHQTQNWDNSSGGPLVPEPGAGGEKPDKMATQVEFWECLPIPENERKTEEDRKRPWKIVVSILANGTVIRKRRRPFRHKLFPFAKCPCYPVNGQFFSISEMSLLESPQDQINRMVAYECDLIRMASNPSRLIHTMSGVSTKDITNRLAGYIRWRGEAHMKPEWETPPPFRSEVFQSQSNAKQHMDMISGVYASFRGNEDQGAKSGVALKTLAQGTAGRIGQKSRLFEIFIRDIAAQVIELHKQFSTDKIIRVGGGRYLDVNKRMEDGTLDPETDITQDDYEVEVGVGSALPVDKAVRFDQFLELYDRGVVTDKQLLKRTGIEEEEAEKMIKEKEEQASAQAGMGQAQGGAPAPKGAGATGQTNAQDALPGDDEIARLEAMAGNRA